MIVVLNEIALGEADAIADGLSGDGKCPGMVKSPVSPRKPSMRFCAKTASFKVVGLNVCVQLT